MTIGFKNFLHAEMKKQLAANWPAWVQQFEAPSRNNTAISYESFLNRLKKIDINLYHIFTEKFSEISYEDKMYIVLRDQNSDQFVQAIPVDKNHKINKSVPFYVLLHPVDRKIEWKEHDLTIRDISY